MNARAHARVDVFGTLGYTRARFGDGAISSGVDVSDNDIPNTPEYTASLGAQFNHAVTAAVSLYGRGEIGFSGAFRYDDLNREGQEAYSLANFRAGVRGRYVFGEVWVRNAFDTHYIPVAFAYGAAGAVGVRRGDGRAADVRGQWRGDVLADGRNGRCGPLEAQAVARAGWSPWSRRSP